MGTGKTTQDRRTGKASSLIGGAAAGGAALLVVLLFAAPILFLRISEARERLEALLRRTRAVHAHQGDRLVSARATFDRQVEDSSRSQDEELEYVETRIDRMQPRPVSEVRLPDALPLPHDVAPAVQPHEAAPTPEAAVAGVETHDPAPPAATVDEATRNIVATMLRKLTRALDLAPSQQDRCAAVLTDYTTRIRARLEEARAGRGAGAAPDMEAIRTAAVDAIQGTLTAEQTVTFENLKKKVDRLNGAGLVVRPLPGAGVPQAN